MNDLTASCNKYGRCLIEIVNLVKDMIYCISVSHTNIYLQFMLWGFALFPFYFNLIRIMIMNQKQYIKHYGKQESVEVAVIITKIKSPDST